jgi:hypothetical protein
LVCGAGGIADRVARAPLVRRRKVNLTLMAKKKNPMLLHDRLALRVSISEQVTTLIARCGRLRDAGSMDEARRLLVRIERLTGELNQLEM